MGFAGGGKGGGGYGYTIGVEAEGRGEGRESSVRHGWLGGAYPDNISLRHPDSARTSKSRILRLSLPECPKSELSEVSIVRLDS